MADSPENNKQQTTISTVKPSATAAPATVNPQQAAKAPAPQQAAKAPAPQQAPTKQQPTPKQSLQDFGLTSLNVESQVEQLRYVIKSMLAENKVNILFGGDTGIGKTSFIQLLSKVLGLPVTIVEVPHLVEEHIINIPFVNYESGKKIGSGIDQVKYTPDLSTKTPKVVLGTSYLASRLSKIRKTPDNEYANDILKYDEYTKQVLQEFDETYPGWIDKVRNKYERILFLDEYFRTTSTAVRNILRNILIGMIGHDRTPEGTYTTYASNIDDEGIDKTKIGPEHVYFQKLFKPPSKDQWLSYTVSKAIDSNITIKPEVVKAFNTILKDEHISFNEIEFELRISPRRWSEIFLYINNAFPFKNPEEIGILISIIKRQFQSDEGQTSNLYQAVEGILASLSEKSKIDFNKVKPVSSTEWRDILKYQVLSVMAIGKSKKYIPVMQGLPGVGKTSFAQDFEKPPFNMRVIIQPATGLTTEDIIGINIPEKSDEKFNVQFSKPPLAIKIENEIEREVDAYFKRLQELEKNNNLDGKTASQVFQEFENQKYKYLIFIDEINRVKDVNVFNSLRKLILEKEYNDQYALPEGSVVVAAMNPTGVGTIQLTKHFRDSVELLNTLPEWTKTISYIRRLADNLKEEQKNSQDAITLSLDLIEDFPKKFALTKRKESREYYITVGGSEEIFLGPRSYTELFLSLPYSIDSALSFITSKRNKGKTFSQEEINAKVANNIFEDFEAFFQDRFRAAEMEVAPEGFYDKLKDFLYKSVNISLKQKSTLSGIGPILDMAIAGKTQLPDDINFDNYMNPNNYAPPKFERELELYLFNLMKKSNLENFDNNMVLLVDQMIKAVDKNNYDRDILEKIEPAMHKAFADYVKTEVKNDQIDTVVQLGKLYNLILDKLEIL